VIELLSAPFSFFQRLYSFFRSLCELDALPTPIRATFFFHYPHYESNSPIQTMYSNALASLAAAVLLFSSALEIAASSSNGAGHAINHVPLDARHGRLQRARRVANNSSWNLMAACITDAPAPGRLLSVSSNLPTTLTPAVCQRACDAGGYVYAGLQYGDECWCAHELNYNANAGQAAKNATACNYPCSGDKSQQCGGFWHVSRLCLAFALEPTPRINVSSFILLSALFSLPKI
jgi:hypothetical protein